MMNKIDIKNLADQARANFRQNAEGVEANHPALSSLAVQSVNQVTVDALGKGASAAELAALKSSVARSLAADGHGEAISALAGGAGAAQQAASIFQANERIQSRFDQIFAAVLANAPDQAPVKVNPEAVKAVLVKFRQAALDFAVENAHDLWFQQKVVAGKNFQVEFPDAPTPKDAHKAARAVTLGEGKAKLEGRAFAEPSWVLKEKEGHGKALMIANNLAGGTYGLEAMVHYASGHLPVQGNDAAPYDFYKACIQAHGQGDPLAGAQPMGDFTKGEIDAALKAVHAAAAGAIKILQQVVSWDAAPKETPAAYRAAGLEHDMYVVRNGPGLEATPEKIAEFNADAWMKDTFVDFGKLAGWIKDMDLPTPLFAFIGVLQGAGKVDVGA